MTQDPQQEPEPLEPVEGEPGWGDDGPLADPSSEPSTEPPTEQVRTGSPRVDEVIRAVEELEERPLEEHVGVFESAQAQLRRALDEPGDDDQAVDADLGGDHPGDRDHPGHA